MNHKAGYINILGKPNVGKSTLMNAIVGERVSIVTSKAQTTRHRILGIVNDENYQLIFSDLPGIIKPAYKMQESMMDFVRTSFDDADTFIYVVETGDKPENQPEEYEKIKKMDVPVLLLMNKIDLAMQEEVEEQLAIWIADFPTAQVIPFSAKLNLNTDLVLKTLIEILPESPPYFDNEEWTDKPERFFVTEVIREKILMNYKQEIPYSCEVVCMHFQEEETIIRISVDIYVERESQKPILIGKGGSMLKKIGTQARIDLEKFFAKKIYLETHVRVADNWRNNDSMLRKFGYRE